MRTGRSTATRGLAAAGAAAGLALAALGAGSAASADEGTSAAAAATGTKTISMRADRRGPRFTGSATVRTGQELRIRNLSDPRQIGPHTFSLIATNAIPKSRKAMQQCFSPGKICMTIAQAHDLNPQTEDIGKVLAEAGKAGWDKRFSRTSRTGDSWYTETKGEEFSQPVSAKAGTVLRYICAVHPEMQGKIRVTG